MDQPAERARLRSIFDGLTVLVVDDDVACRDALQYLLEELGARVLIAADGVGALAVVREHAPDLVLSDLAMPRLDGYALVRQLREDQARTGLPVIAVSASFADQPAVPPGSGIDAALAKPFSYHDLDQALSRLMWRRPELFKRQRMRLRARAMSERAQAKDVRDRFRFLYDALQEAKRRRPGSAAA